MSLTALGVGALATVIAFAALPLVTWAFFVSPLSMVLGGVIAHTIGTAVATVLDLSSPERTIWKAGRRLMIAGVCGIALWVVFLSLYTGLAYASTHFTLDYWWVELIVVMAMALWLCAVSIRRVEPAWPRYAAQSSRWSSRA